MSEANKAIARDYLETAWNRKDLNAVDRYITDNHVYKGPFTDGLPPGAEGSKAFVGAFIAAFPDVYGTIEKQEVDGDWVMTHITFVGTQTGQLMDIPPTGKKTTVPVKVSDRIVDGKIVETIAEWDADDMLRQLGIS